MRRLKKIFNIMTILFLLGTVDCGPWTSSFAAVPHLINYQGKLTDNNGVPLEGSYAITFRIYDGETAGNLLWEETQAGVVVQKGVFSVLLGSVANLGLAFDKPYFLEIKVGNEVMSPRQRITSTGYAIRAELAEGVDGPGKVGTKEVDETNITDGKVPVYRASNGKLNYENMPSIDQVSASGSVNFSSETTMATVNKTITSGKKVLVLCTGLANGSTSQPPPGWKIKIKYGSTIIRERSYKGANGYDGPIGFALHGVVTGLSGSLTFTATIASDSQGSTYGAGSCDLTVLEF